MCVCVYAVGVSCFRVEYGPGCSVWRGVGGRWGGVDVDVIERVEGGVEFSSGWRCTCFSRSSKPLCRQGPFS